MTKRKTRGYRGYIGCASSRLISLGPGISDNTNGKTEKQYDNTKGIVLDVWRGVLPAAPGMAHLAEVLQSRLWVHGGRSPDIVIIVTY